MNAKKVKKIKTISKRVIILGVLVGVAAFFGTHYTSKLIKATGQGQMAALPVDVFVAEEKDFYPEQSFVARIESRDRVAIRARVQGFLMRRLFTEGDFVKEGQVLYLIEQDKFMADVRRAEANLAGAEASEENAAAQYKRGKDLIKTKDISEARLDELEAAYSSAKAAVKQTQSDLDIARLNLDYTEIKAPMDGKIGESFYSVGAIIGPESGDLAYMVSTSPMDAVFSVSENQLLEMKKSAAEIKDVPESLNLSFVFSDGETYALPGELNFVDVALDSNMNTLKMKVAFQNPNNELISGQYGRVLIRFRKPQKAIIIPRVALQRDLGGTFVYVVDKEGRLAKKTVETKMDVSSSEVALRRGLNAGDKIIVNNFQTIGYLPSGYPMAIENAVK